MSQLESLRVLLVDDDVSLLESWKAVLSGQCEGHVARSKPATAALEASLPGERT